MKWKVIFVAIVVLSPVGLWWHVKPVLEAQALPKGIRQATPTPVDIAGPPTVDLPHGQKFVSIISANDAGNVAGGTYLNIYVTEVRPASEQPRRLTFYQAGYSPHSWKEVLYIQEH